jgi:hypothetical protein
MFYLIGSSRKGPINNVVYVINLFFAKLHRVIELKIFQMRQVKTSFSRTDFVCIIGLADGLMEIYSEVLNNTYINAGESR